MDFRFTEEEERFRWEVEEFLDEAIPPRWYEISGEELDTELTDEAWSIICDFRHKLGEKGWLAPSYPKEYGGAELDITKQLILVEELNLRRAPSTRLETIIGADWVGPTIRHYGSEEDKKKYLIPLAKGDLIVCLLFTEPEAGSDLGGIQTKAIREGDYYVVNGQKLYITAAQHSDYGFLLARTDPDATRHKGLSMFIVDMKSPGVTVEPLINIVGVHHFNTVYLENVKIPKVQLLGDENMGFYELIAELAYERSLFWLPPALKRSLDGFILWARETKFDGKSFLDDPVVQAKIAKLATRIEIGKLLSYKTVTTINKGQVPVAEGSMLYLVCGEIMRDMVDVITNIMGLYGQLLPGSKWAPLNGRTATGFLSAMATALGAGTLEIRRNTIGQIGLGLPKSY